MKQLPFLSRCVLGFAALVLATSTPARAERVQLAQAGRASMPVVVSDKATPETRQAAERLAEMLGKITQSACTVTTGDGATGIALGLASDFPQVNAGISGREGYLLHSHASGLQLIGAAPAGVEHATWDLLYRLGYRQFFPGETWEVIPHEKDLAIDVDVREQPVYQARRIWYGFGGWDFRRAGYQDWCRKNRAAEGFQLNSGHSYDGIIHKHAADFTAHPEYYALVGGVRKGPKLCISNPELRRLVVADALDRCAKDPQGDSISMDPSDGGGWCECPECAKLGSVTDQALTLANEVAEAIQKPYPGRVVGMYAYSFHSPPPHIRVHPQVVISVATAFVKGGLSQDEIINGWAAQGARLGIREYYSVNTWDRDLPGAARGANLDYLRRTIPYFASRGAQFLSAESSDNWGPNGLGYYIAARLMWDPREAGHVEALVEDFLKRAFGPAREPMRAFYQQLDGSAPHLVKSDQLGRMFRALDEARRLDPPAEVCARLDDLTLYARYVQLFHAYADATGAARQAAFEALIRHAYRMRKTGMMHSQALYRDLDKRDNSVAIPSDASWRVPDAQNPWKSSEPFTNDELAQFIKAGMEANGLVNLTFQPVGFSNKLVPATPLHLQEPPTGELKAGRATQIFYTYVGQPKTEIALKVTGGLIAHYRDRGPVKIALWQIGGASETGEHETLIKEDRSVLPDGQEHAVKLAAPQPALYKLVVNDGSDSTLIKLSSPLPWSVKSDNDEPLSKFYGDWTLCFYVPKGTKTVGLFGGGAGDVCDSSGKALFSLQGREPSFYGVPVPPEQDGRLWQIKKARGSVRLLTVPPYLARTAAELLLPAEVVEKDAGK